MSTSKKQSQDDAVVQLWEEAIKDRYSALIETRVSYTANMQMYTLACNRSSKSRAASFFNSEMLFENRLIVSLPNVGTCLKLCPTEAREHSSLSSVRNNTVPAIKLMDEVFV